jgi:hypothetical protein
MYVIQVFLWDSYHLFTAFLVHLQHISRVPIKLFVHLYAYNSLRMAEHIFMKCGMEVMSLETSPNT